MICVVDKKSVNLEERFKCVLLGFFQLVYRGKSCRTTLKSLICNWLSFKIKNKKFQSNSKLARRTVRVIHAPFTRRAYGTENNFLVGAQSAQWMILARWRHKKRALQTLQRKQHRKPWTNSLEMKSSCQRKCPGKAREDGREETFRRYNCVCCECNLLRINFIARAVAKLALNCHMQSYLTKFIMHNDQFRLTIDHARANHSGASKLY